MAAKPASIYPTVKAIEKSITRGIVEAVHRYANPDTKVIELAILRIRDEGGKKTFLQFKPSPGGGYCAGAPEKPWPIYNRTRIRPAAEVVIVEGEKCVEALAAASVPATTSPCGAGKAEHADWSPLAGKTCYLWPDADPPDPKTGKRGGIDHMRGVALELEKLDPRPRIVWIDPDILGLPPKGDAVDFLAEMIDADGDVGEQVWNVLHTIGIPLGVASEVGQLIEDTIAGRWKAIDWPYPCLSQMSKALLPGTVTLVCGDPGSTKSFLMLDAARYWHEKGVKVALYELEDTRRSHMLRALAQISNESGVTDDDWVRRNPEIAKKIFKDNEARLESFGQIIISPGESHPTPADLAAWVEEQCARGIQIAIIDPITYAAFSDRPWQDDKQFLWTVSAAVRRTGSRLIVVTHPRKGGSGIAKSQGTLDDLAGGAAYPRHAQTVLWVQRKDPPEQVNVTRIGLSVGSAEINRIVKIVKARNGKGQGTSLGFWFNGSTLRFKEEGAITKKPVFKDTMNDEESA